MEKQRQAQLLCWEKFLHKKTIRILLLETDDCTRLVVTALLRQCMYQVIPVQNGQQAWKYLQYMQTNIDLVLTEIVPGLLDRIMTHNVCQSIPVIMMSSNVSMNTVFECVSKGAADFLVKPLRRNELKNLWQHLWRRCDGSTGSNGSNGDTSMGLNSRDGSDNGSGNQGRHFHVFTSSKFTTY